MKRLTTCMLICLALLRATPLAARDADDNKLRLIDAAELHLLAGLGQSSANGVDAEATAYGAGFHLSMFPQETMLDGWTGIEFMLRMGMMEHFFLDARVVAPWSIYHNEYVEVAAGLGAKVYALFAIEAGYMTHTASARLGLGFGPAELRLEYDYLILVGGHEVSAFIPLVGGLGVGAHLAVFTDKKDYSQVSMDALVFYRF